MRRGLPARRLILVQNGGGTVQEGAAGDETRFRQSASAWYAQGLSGEEQRQIARSMAKSGVPAGSALALFAAARFFAMGASATAAYFAAPGDSGFPMLPALCGAAVAIACWLVSLVPIRFQLKQHRKSAGDGLPDALELLAICVGAGLSLESALQRVAAEMKLSRPALSGELELTWAEISISPDREQALANFAERVNLPAVRSVIGTLAQSMRFGTPLTQSLRSAANEMRNLQLIALEKRAARLPALLTIPVMLFIMPAIFLIVGGPAAIKLVDLFGQP
jgi:tight adherence protein C